MARLQKDIVDYFPHDAGAAEGDTLTVLQAHYGNDGYAFWFKLLEKLASSEGHYIDCGNPKLWQLLLARALVKHDDALEMMKLLVEMGSIDRELWAQGIIWSQQLVDNVADVYKNRGREKPQRPKITMPHNAITTERNCIVCGKTLEGMRSDAKYCSDKCRLEAFRETDKGISTPNNAITILNQSSNLITTPNNSITTPGNTQSKVKESKVNNTPKGGQRKAVLTQKDPIITEIFTEMRTYLGFPDKTDKDPIPSYGKEGQAIKRMLARGFTREEILACWKGKVSQRGGEFVSMTWVNEDIGKTEKQKRGVKRLSTEEEIAASIQEATTWHGDK